jgi:hypothetical protein
MQDINIGFFVSLLSGMTDDARKKAKHDNEGEEKETIQAWGFVTVVNRCLSLPSMIIPF